MNIKKHDILKIMSFKHNGYIHRVWNSAEVIAVDSEKVVVLTKKCRVQEATKRVWYTKEPAILFFYFNEWFNTIAMMRPDGIYYYTNISSPCVVDNGAIKYIDYDLDVKTFRHDSYKVLDMNEFYCHKYSMKYPKVLEAHLLSTVDEVVKRFSNNVLPFSDDEVYAFYNDINSN